MINQNKDEEENKHEGEIEIEIENKIDLVNEKSLQMLNSFMSNNLFKQALKQIFQDRLPVMTPLYFMQLKDMCYRLDKDWTKSISLKNFLDAVSKVGVAIDNDNNNNCKQEETNLNAIKKAKERFEKMFDGAVDMDKENVFVNYLDLLNVWIKKYLIYFVETIYYTCREFDHDDDGRIKVYQLIDAVNKSSVAYYRISSIIDHVKNAYDEWIDYDKFVKQLHPDYDQIPKWFVKWMWMQERVIWIGFQKNINNQSCYIARLPKVIVSKILTYIRNSVTDKILDKCSAIKEFKSSSVKPSIS